MGCAVTEECQVINADEMTELEKNCHFETTSKVINWEKDYWIQKH